MARAKGINSHKVFKLGKAAAKRDKRNFKFATLLKAVPALPPSYDFDTKHPGIPTPMFSNDTLGCCVISGRAHQTLRFEDIEQPVRLQGIEATPVRVGDRALIGARAAIQRGVTIGEGAQVAAQSVVTRDVAPAARVGGVPAQPALSRSARSGTPGGSRSRRDR